MKQPSRTHQHGHLQAIPFPINIQHHWYFFLLEQVLILNDQIQHLKLYCPALYHDRLYKDWNNYIDSFYRVIVNNLDPGGSQLFEASPRGPDCQILNGKNFTYDWASTNTDVAELNQPTYTNSYREIFNAVGDDPINIGQSLIQSTI